jgi:hypothetical protein
LSKAARIAHLKVQGLEGVDPHMAGWFACFNRGDYYEAHDVLEALWLSQRSGPDDRFYKGLIQLAGAFVHLQKSRLRPADALFRLAEANLSAYPPSHQRLHVAGVLGLVREWRDALARDQFEINPMGRLPPPVVLPEKPGPDGS